MESIMQQNYYKCFSLVILLVMFLFPQYSSGQTEKQISGVNSESALTEDVITKTPQTNIPLLSAEQISRIQS